MRQMDDSERRLTQKLTTDDEYSRFERLARAVVKTPEERPADELADALRARINALREPTDEDTEREQP